MTDGKLPLIDETCVLKDGTTLTLRSARAGDARQVRALRQALHAETEFYNQTAREADLGWLGTRASLSAASGSGHHLILLAWLGKELVGETQIRRSRTARLAHDTRLSLGIAPGHERKGIGKALIQAASQWARCMAGAKRISLAAHASNTAALALYSQCGFLEEGRRISAIGPRQPGGAFDDEVLMALRLDEDDDRLWRKNS